MHDVSPKNGSSSPISPINKSSSEDKELLNNTEQTIQSQRLSQKIITTLAEADYSEPNSNGQSLIENKD